MVEIVSCPDASKLRDYAQGAIAAEEAKQLAQHLAECQSCFTKVAVLQPDSIGKGDTESAHLEATVAVSASKAKVDVSFLEPPQQPDEIGRLGTFRVKRIVGAGGMGIVFEAHDTQLDRRVALKVMRPEYAAESSARERFLVEAQGWRI